MPVLSLNQKGFVPLLLPIIILALVIGGFGGYLLGRNNTKQKTIINTQQQSSPSGANNNSVQSDEILNKLNYAAVITPSNDSNNWKRVYMTKDQNGTRLYLASYESSRDNMKVIYQLGVGSLEFGSPFINGNYLFVPIGGDDLDDILVFDTGGKLIYEGIRKNNPELNSWSIRFKEFESGNPNTIKIVLSHIDGSQESVLIDLSTGKVVPNSLINLGKVKN